MKWTLEILENLENQIMLLYHTTKLSDDTLADVMGKIDNERYNINQANGVVTGDELELPIQIVSKCCNAMCNEDVVEGSVYCEFHKDL